MSEPKAPKPSVADQAKVLSAFVRAFGKTLLSGRSTHQRVVAQLQDTPEGTSRLWARNAKLMLEEGLVLLLDELQAELRMRDARMPLIPEAAESYSFNIQLGRIAMDAASIAHLMNRYAFPARGPLYNLTVALPDEAVVLEGTLRLNRLLTIRLYLRCRVGVTTAGLLELTPEEIRSGALPLDRIFNLLGVELGRFLPEGATAGVRFEDGRILVDPMGLLPAPTATGRLVHAEVRGEHLVMSYDNGAPPSTPPLILPEAEAYLAMLGHDLLVGKITMADVSLQLVPLVPEGGWVEFALPYYRSQLEQGESSLHHGDELLYKLPAIAEVKKSLLPVPSSGPRRRA